MIVCVRRGMRAGMRACVRACMHVYVHVCMHACVVCVFTGSDWRSKIKCKI